jgi:hypothetical protein
VHSEEQHTQSKDSRFDCCNCHSYNLYFYKFSTLQVGVVVVTTFLKLF